MNLQNTSANSNHHPSCKPASGKKARRTRKLKTPLFRLSVFTGSGIVLVVLICALSMVFTPLPSSLAANPPSGTIGPAGPTNTWNGPAIGGASANESTCVEGVNCDTYALNVTGLPTDWTGKLIAIKIAWTVPASDYDRYVHYDANNNGMLDSTDPVAAQGANGGAPGTEENTTIDPSSTG